jgi:hypothetical protein
VTLSGGESEELLTIDPQCAMKMQPELLSGEKFYWAGKPNPHVIFHSDDWYAIPFSLLWGGFAIFWEVSVLGGWGNVSHGNPISWFFTLWGIPFVVIGQFMIWGRFFFDAWLKRRTYYAVTNRRVLVLQEGWKQKTRFTQLEAVVGMEIEGEAIGTIWFGPKYPVIAGRGQKSRGWSRFSVGEVVVFADVDDARALQRLILELREAAERDGRARSGGMGPLTYPMKD